jgi:hypothetical protein
MNLLKISFRPTPEEINYLMVLNEEKYHVNSVTKLMHAIFSDIMPDIIGNTYLKQLKSKDMLHMMNPREGMETSLIDSYNSINNQEPDLLTKWVEGMEMLARYKKALDTINGK